MKELFENINVSKILKYLLYMFLSLVAQTMVIGQIRIFGVAAMLLPAVSVSVGMFEGATMGAIFSVIMGVFADMSFVENTAFFSLFLPMISFAAGFISQFFVNRRFFAFMGISFVALLATAVLQMLKTAAGDGWSTSMISTVVLQSLLSLPGSAAAYFPAAKWIK